MTTITVTHPTTGETRDFETFAGADLFLKGNGGAARADSTSSRRVQRNDSAYDPRAARDALAGNPIALAAFDKRMTELEGGSSVLTPGKGITGSTQSRLLGAVARVEAFIKNESIQTKLQTQFTAVSEGRGLTGSEVTPADYERDQKARAALTKWLGGYENDAAPDDVLRVLAAEAEAVCPAGAVAPPPEYSPAFDAGAKAVARARAEATGAMRGTLEVKSVNTQNSNEYMSKVSADLFNSTFNRR